MSTRTLSLSGISLALFFAVAIPAYAETTGTPTHGGASMAPTIMQQKPPVDYSCIQKAVDTREDAVGTAFSAFATSESAALSARKTALHDAWGMGDAKARRTARNKAWGDFRTASKTAHSALKTAKESPWKDFEVASKACKTPVVEKSGTEGVGSLGL